MKKTVKLTHPKIKLDRLVDAAKHDIKKYLKRERNKPLPEGAIFWDFECKFGITEADAVSVHLSELGKRIEELAKQQVAKQLVESCYIEILAKPSNGIKVRRSN